jgi:hypothetical protein
MRVGLVAVVIVLAVGVLTLSVAGSVAAFTDAAAQRSGPLNAATLAAPTALTCTNGAAGSGTADIGWTPTTTGAAHRVDAESTPGVWVSLGTVGVGVRKLQVTAAMMASLLSLGATYRIRVVAVAGTAWSSSPSATTVTLQTISLLGLGLALACYP